MTRVHIFRNVGGWRENRCRLLLGVGVGLLLAIMFQGPLTALVPAAGDAVGLGAARRCPGH